MIAPLLPGMAANLRVSVWALGQLVTQARLIGIAGHKVAPIVLSLNASFMFIGFSAGAAAATRLGRPVILAVLHDGPERALGTRVWPGSADTPFTASVLITRINR